MGDFPRHWCERDDGYNVVMPMSVLDCDQSRCIAAAELAATLARSYSAEQIKAEIDLSQRVINRGFERRARWELTQEAKTRTTA